MASSTVEMKNNDGGLKHLGFVRIIAINAAVCVSHLYEYAKQNSGSLKSTVGTVENAVTTVVGPVYERIKGVPDDALAFLDKKVDEATFKFDEHAPPFVKKVLSKAQYVVQKASQFAQEVVQEAQVGGPRSAICLVGSLSKNFAVGQFAVLWYKVNRYPPLHAVSEMAVPTVAHWSEKYNNFVTKLAARGYPIFSYFPRVPIEDMAKAYRQVEAASVKKDNGVVSSETD